MKLLDPETNKDITLPCYMTEGSSGMDISACVKNSEVLKPFEIKLIPTGFSLEIPKGFEAQIRPRSGLAVKKGVTIVNSPGTIDSDYRGEVKVGLINLSDKDYIIERGARIAQMVIQKVEKVIVKKVDAIEDTTRNHGGFGHTGV
ncbi:MAG: dUTP diphosphatase [Thermodesulfobacteriota bacterium]